MIFVPKSSPMNLIGMSHSRSLIKPCRIHKIVLVVFRITKAMAGKKISREKTTLLHPYADSERCRQVNTETDSVRSILITTLNEFDDHCLRDALQADLRIFLSIALSTISHTL